MMNSPYYNPQIDFQSNAPKVKKEIGEALSDDDEAMN